MNYPIAIHKDKKSDYGVTVPDLPGCFSAGKTLEEAITNSKEAILCHIEGMIQDQENIPDPTSIETHKNDIKYKDAVWAIVTVDISELSGKAKRVNITVPERFLHQIDIFAQKRGESRSGLFVSAALEYVSRHQK